MKNRTYVWCLNFLKKIIGLYLIVLFSVFMPCYYSRYRITTYRLAFKYSQKLFCRKRNVQYDVLSFALSDANGHTVV